MWISFSDKHPELSQEIIVFKSNMIGGYDTGVYVASYEQFKGKKWVIIKDCALNHNNWRPFYEFSHWMPVPEIPAED